MSKSRRLNIFLIKKNIKSYKACIKDPDELIEYKLRNDLTFNGRFFIRPPKSKPPDWLEFVQPHLVPDIDELASSSQAAVLLITVENQILAFTFGSGRYLLEDDSYENGFGLRVSLNTVKTDSLRSVDHQAFEDLRLNTRKQTSRKAPIEKFGLDIRKDLMKSITGIPEDKDFATSISGSDSLSITTDAAFNEIGDKCKDILKYYRMRRFKTRYPWIENIAVVKKKSVIDKLQKILLRELTRGNIEDIDIAPPGIVEWPDIKAFKYSTKKDSMEYIDMTIDDFYDQVEIDQNLDLDILKKFRIQVLYKDEDESSISWSLFKCLVFQSTYKGELYVLSNGDWYHIDKDFIKQVNASYLEIHPPEIDLPLREAHDKTEGRYNEYAADSSDDLLLMDKKLVRPPGGSSSIEFCDLISSKGQFIHVKMRGASSMLSHLFSQGLISASLFIESSDFRKVVYDKIEEENPAFAELIPIAINPNPGDYEVSYIVVAKKKGDETRELPFFSKLNLVQHAQQLGMLGFYVTFEQIGIE